MDKLISQKVAAISNGYNVQPSVMAIMDANAMAIKNT